MIRSHLLRRLLQAHTCPDCSMFVIVHRCKDFKIRAHGIHSDTCQHHKTRTRS